MFRLNKRAVKSPTEASLAHNARQQDKQEAPLPRRAQRVRRA